MAAAAERARAFSLVFLVASACNGQFDFDTALLDAEPPTIAPEAGRDVASPEDATPDGARPGVRIACGASECQSSGCCTTSTTATCVDIDAGGMCGGLLIQCDDTDDCPAGQVCCAEGASNSPSTSVDPGNADDRPQRVHCEPEAHCRSMNFVILCNPYRPNPCTQCIATTLTGLPPGYHQCAAAP